MSSKSGKNNSDKDKFKIQPFRRWIQVAFLSLLLWIGIEFVLFVNQLEQGITPTVSRPPGVEAFLPISALISLKYWLYTGIFNTIHPSALVLLLSFVIISLLLKKGFCSWICPFGLLSEGLSKIHKWTFDRQLKLPKWLDYPLRSLKYLLLFFFVWAIFGQMTVEALHKFIYSPYNRVADIKMLYFFSDMSSMTFWVLMILLGLSVAIPYFWCRYLCPYGALVGAVSWLSPFKIHRNKTTCIDCDKCTKVCPANIQVHKAGAVFSDECHACLYCLDACPVKNTLYLSTTQKGFKLSPKVYAFALVIIFLISVSMAQLLDVWQNKIPAKEYIYHIKNINSSEYFHAQGEVSAYDEEKWQPRSHEQIMELEKRIHK